MRKLILMLLSAVVLSALFYPVFAQDTGGTPKFVGLDVYQRADQAYQNQQYEQAISDFSIVILLNPTFTDPYIKRAESYIALKNFDAALVDLNHLLKIPLLDAATKAEAYTARGEISRDQNDLNAAMADYNAAIRAAPDGAQAYYDRGLIYLAQGEYDKSLKDLNQVASIAPKYIPTYYYLGVLNNQAKQYADAVKHFDTYLQAVTDNFQAYAGRADAYIQQEMYQQGLADLNQALKVEPRAANLYLQRGMVQQKLGAVQASANDYLEWIRSNVTGDQTKLVIRPNESQVLAMATGKVYILSFDGEAGQKVTISTSTPKDHQIDSLIVLADEQLTPIIADDDSAGNMNATIKDFVLPISGSYAIILSHAGGNPEGPVRLLMTLAN